MSALEPPVIWGYQPAFCVVEREDGLYGAH